MKNTFWKVFFLILSFTFIMPNIGEAYRCTWKNGRQVCWYKHRQHVKNCFWVDGFWRNGYYYPRQKICRYR